MKRRTASTSGNATSGSTRRFSVVCDRGTFARIQERVADANVRGDRQTTLSSVARTLILKGLGAADVESEVRKKGAAEVLQQLKRAIHEIEQALRDDVPRR